MSRGLRYLREGRGGGGVNRGMQIHRSALFFGWIRRSDFIFAHIRIRITEELLLRNLGVQKYSKQLRKFWGRSHRDRVGNWRVAPHISTLNYEIIAYISKL